MDQRMQFILKTQEEGANISDLCRQIGISRMVGYKWISRFEEGGLQALCNQSRRPKTISHETSSEMVCRIVELRTKRPTWGGKKIGAYLLRDLALKNVPGARTIDRILDRCHLVPKRRHRKRKLLPQERIIAPKVCNDVWTVDFKGWWILKNKERCDPLTLRDGVSRFLLELSALRSQELEAVKDRFKSAFEIYGLPLYIRSDNGTPFSFRRGLCGLTRLSVWWLKLGITPNRIPPGSPQFNGAHERMHGDMMRELERTPGKNQRDQQNTFDLWREDFNYERPHEALLMKTPSQLYQASPRKYDPSEPDYKYPSRFELRRVMQHGRFNWRGQEIFLSKALTDQTIGLEVIDDDLMKIWFTDYCLGYTDAKFKKPFVEYSLLGPEPEKSIASTSTKKTDAPQPPTPQ